VDVPFDLAKAKKWARETGSGVLLGRTYRNNSLAGQGHVAVLLPDGKVLQSFQFGAGGEPGLNTDYTVEESHAGGYYEVMVHPSAWINHDKGQIREAPTTRPKVDRQDAGGKLAGGQRNGDRDEERPQGSQVAERPEGDDGPDFEELGREVFALIRRYTDKAGEPRMQSETRKGRVDEHHDRR